MGRFPGAAPARSVSQPHAAGAMALGVRGGAATPTRTGSQRDAPSRDRTSRTDVFGAASLSVAADAAQGETLSAPHPFRRGLYGLGLEPLSCSASVGALARPAPPQGAVRIAVALAPRPEGEAALSPRGEPGLLAGLLQAARP